MKTYKLFREQLLPIGITEAWDFFSSPANLSKITPQDMAFEIITHLENKPIYSGMKIEYKVRPMLNIPLRWTTEITNVDAPYKFADIQLKGPYSLWEHTHTFVTVPGGVKMTDEVRYALPLGWIGNLAHAIFVKKRLESIFDFREKSLNTFFSNNH